jgi:hypothetical protein
MENIPEYVKGTILPPGNLSVLEIVSIATPPITNPPALLHIKELFSKIPSVIQDATAARVLLGLCIPSTKDLQELKTRAYDAKRNGFISFSYPVRPMSTLQLPLWVLDFWEAAHQVINSKSIWNTAIQWIRSKEELRALTLFEQLPWTGKLGQHMKIEDLALLCSEKWLSSDYMDLFSTVINDELRLSGNLSASVIPTNILEKIIQLYRYSQKSYPDEKSVAHIRRLGEALANRTYKQVAMSVSVRIEEGESKLPTDILPGNHWATLIWDIERTSLLYADSYQHPPPDELHNVLLWWLQHHREETFQWVNLPCSSQTDGFSCPILSANSIAHALLPTSFPLIPENGGISARIDMLLLIASFWKRNNTVCHQLYQ